MEPKQLEKLTITALEDMKAVDITSIYVKPLTDITEYIIICTGTSSRHTASIADHLVTQAKSKGVKPLGVEGDEFGEWILVDLGDAVIHIMLAQVREFYNLEKLWNMAEESRKTSAD